VRFEYRQPRSPASQGRQAIAACVLAASCVTPAFADDEPDLGSQWVTQRAEAEVLASRPADADRPPPYGDEPNYVLPVYEIIGFNALLNLYDRHFEGDDYKSTWSSVRRNLHSSWVTDQDPFSINQLYHPYQGATYFGIARSAGVDYWKSLLYSFGGSAMWEIAGEKTPPSFNDLVNTGLGGSFFGEALFRLAGLLLEDESIPPFWREAGAALISPPTGFNRLAFGNRYRGVFDSHDPATYNRLYLGFSGTAQNAQGTSTTRLRRNEALAEYAIDYGLPGKPGYTYDRPFDYFSLKTTASTANGFENLMIRGMLLGKGYGHGDDVRGIVGMYGSYDYVAPQTYRISSTALSLGTTAQWWAASNVAVQGTLMGGAGYAAVGTVDSNVDADYRYGLAPQALAAMRVIVGDRLSLDVTGREWFVSRVAASGRGGHDNIARLEAMLTYRVYEQHGVALRYLGNRRDASYADSGDLSQSRSTIGLFYVLLGRDRLGAVEWRKPPE
jgi:hypothetical protein